jgi:hypothetical protein
MIDSAVKVNEFVIAVIKKIILSEILNSLSPRFFSFTVPAVGERSDNPFLRLLNFFGKNAEMPQGNS